VGQPRPCPSLVRARMRTMRCRPPPGSPSFFDPHVCTPPPTADLIGREMDFTCSCGRRWRLEHYLIEGQVLGPSWILL
jgi:hypothetical protein